MFNRYKEILIKKLSKALGLAGENEEELRGRGVIIGNNCHIYGGIERGHGFLVTIGDDVTIASGAKVLTHDGSTKYWLGYSKVGRVTIGSRVFIGANAIVLPNVVIGDDVIIGAGSIVCNNIPGNSVAVGNPARVIGSLDDYVSKNRELLKDSYVGDKYWKDMDESDIQNMQKAIKEGSIGFDI